jgi:hypothetical protein
VEEHTFLFQRGENHVLQHVILRGNQSLGALGDKLVGLQE